MQKLLIVFTVLITAMTSQASFSENGDLVPKDDQTNLTFLSDQVAGRWVKNRSGQEYFQASRVKHEEAVAYCESLNARLPTAKELAIQAQAESGQECVIETSFPEKSPEDSGLKAELKKYGDDSRYNIIWKKSGPQFLVDFYFDHGVFCGLRKSQTRLGQFWTSSSYKSSGMQNFYIFVNQQFNPIYETYANVVCVK